MKLSEMILKYGENLTGMEFYALSYHTSERGRNLRNIAPVKVKVILTNNIKRDRVTFYKNASKEYLELDVKYGFQIIQSRGGKSAQVLSYLGRSKSDASALEFFTSLREADKRYYDLKGYKKPENVDKDNLNILKVTTF